MVKSPFIPKESHEIWANAGNISIKWCLNPLIQPFLPNQWWCPADQWWLYVILVIIQPWKPPLQQQPPLTAQSSAGPGWLGSSLVAGTNFEVTWPSKNENPHHEIEHFTNQNGNLTHSSHLSLSLSLPLSPRDQHSCWRRAIPSFK